MADYDLLGSFSTGGASDLNADLVNKLKDAEKKSVLHQIDKDLESITGLDAETGEELDRLGELDTLLNVKVQALDLMSKVEVFDLSSTSTSAFDQVVASTTGSAAVFDAVDVSGLEPGTTNIEVTQLAQRDVYQSVSFNSTAKDEVLNALEPVPADPDDLAYIAAAGININVGGEDYFFNIVQDPTAATVPELGGKTIEELADEINANENLIASVEQVGTDEYRLVVKSAESGLDNALTITQTNVNLGFGTFESEEITDFDNDRMTTSGHLDINGVEIIAETQFMSYTDIINAINTEGTYTAAKDTDNNTIKITANDGSVIESFELTSTNTQNVTFSNSSKTQSAQNLIANVDGIDYDVSSNTMTIQGNLTMTAVEIGKSTIDIQKDNTAILGSIENIITSYNSLVDLVEDELGDPESNISDSSALRSILSSVKEKLFESYGVNGDQNLFSYGLDIDLQGHLSIDSEKFAEGLNDNYDDIESLLMGNTTDSDIASSDSTKSLGLGYLLKAFLDELDASDGVLTRYETTVSERQTELEEEREEALEALDLKYNTLAKQFSDYGAIITEMESAFSGLKMMIQQSVASK